MIDLKKFSTVLMSTGALLGVLAVPVVGHADDDTDASLPNPTTSKATVNIAASKEGTLTLKKVPNFTFNGDIVNNYSNANKIPGNTDGDLTVDDQTGTAAGWNVTAQLAQFSTTSTNASAKDFSGSGIYLNLGSISAAADSNNSVTNTAPTTAKDASLSPDGAAVNVATANAATSGDRGQGSGKWNMSFSNPALGAIVPWVKATYSADITWTLTAGPTSN